MFSIDSQTSNLLILVFFILNHVIFGHVVRVTHDSKSCWGQGAQLESPPCYLPIKSKGPSGAPGGGGGA